MNVISEENSVRNAVARALLYALPAQPALVLVLADLCKDEDGNPNTVYAIMCRKIAQKAVRAV